MLAGKVRRRAGVNLRFTHMAVMPAGMDKQERGAGVRRGRTKTFRVLGAPPAAG